MIDPSFDCVVVGGGVVGLSIAYELSCRGLTVAVIERGSFGRGASWAGAGILPPAAMETAVHPADKLAALSIQLHRDWATQLLQETGIDTGYRRCGAITVARTQGELAALNGMRTEWRESGIAFQDLSSNELLTMIRELGTRQRRILDAVFVPDEAQIRNPDHIRALLAACRNRGVKLIENAGEPQFDTNTRRIARAHWDGVSLSAATFCFATGAWSSGVLARIGVKISVLPVRGQMILYKLPQAIFSAIINEGTKYIVPRDDGHVLVGSTMEEAGFDTSTTPEAIAHLQEFASSLVEQLQPSKVARSWAGLRPASFDGFPYIGRLPHLENAWAACGHFRTGLLLSPATAQVVADLIVGQELRFDLSPFRVDRG